MTKEVLGFDVPITGVAEDLNELLLLAGGGNTEQSAEEQAAARKSGEEKVYQAALNYIHFHSHYGKLRTALVNKLVELTGKKVSVDKDGKVDEKDTEYVGRVEEEGGEGSLAQYDTQIADAIGAIKVDYTQTARSDGGSLGKKYLAYYDKMVEDGKVEAFAAKHNLDLDGLTEEARKQVVGGRVKELLKAAERAALAGV